MDHIPTPIFQDKLKTISWKKIYAREYGVQYSEMAILCLSPKAKHHIPSPSVDQVIIPEENNTVFYIDGVSWIELVESLNNAYTSHVKKLEDYEKQFVHDGEAYLAVAKKIAGLDVSQISNEKLRKLYQEYQEKLFLYSVFAWTSFILNNYIADKATQILDSYIQKHNKENDKQAMYDSLFTPTKKAAILVLQEKVSRYNGELSKEAFDNLYEQYKWLSCLDIHNKPWTKEEFKHQIASFKTASTKQHISFHTFAKELSISDEDLSYLFMAQSFVYIKDARDDYRRQGVFLSRPLFQELANRMNLKADDVSYLQEKEVIDFLDGKVTIDTKLIAQRKKGFVMYLDDKNSLICLTGSPLQKVLQVFKLKDEDEQFIEVSGRVASQGMVTGKVIIVRGVKDLAKVKQGDVLVAVTTHPDYVSAMRKAVAIVTDEGGITSHSAIVAREFGIPCIVGTKQGTMVFKDGDVVEVNAIDGKVKKIS